MEDIIIDMFTKPIGVQLKHLNTMYIPEHDCKAPACETCLEYQTKQAEDIMLDAEETFNADKRDQFNGWYSVEDVEKAYNKVYLGI